MEEVNCHLCGHAERRIRFRGHDRLHPLPGEFTVVECTHCGFHYLSPRPDPTEILRYYPAEYGAYHVTPGEGDGQFVERTSQENVRNLCETVLRYRSNGNLLDCGCGSGAFLGTMQSYPGWSVRGLEPFAPGVADHVRRRYGIAVDEVPLEEAPYLDASFDVVTLWEVLEHLPQPLQALRRIHRLLRPGGLLVLSAPNRNSFAAMMFGASWIGLDIPRHFSVFSPVDLERALLATGFCKPKIFTERSRLGSAQTELFCLLLSLYMWISSRQYPGRARRLARTVFGRIALQPATIVALFLLTLPYSVLARKLNRGSQMVAVARREEGVQDG